MYYIFIILSPFELYLLITISILLNAIYYLASVKPLRR